MSRSEPYNPLDKKNLGKSVAEALLDCPAEPLGTIKSFTGAGIYAIYYSGDFRPYSPITTKNTNGKFELPIYVGKAVPAGARKGAFGLGANPGRALFNRLKEHAESIQQVQKLNLKHFHCRYLVVDDIWIPLGEALLIAKFSPIWNLRIDGFGNHDPGKGRYEQVRSRWDVLHPGRSWAEKCKIRPETRQQIISELEQYLRSI